MAIATVDDVKIKIGVETLTTFEETQVQFYLDATEPLISEMFGEFNEGTMSEDISYCDLRRGSFYAYNPNPSELLTINGKTYTGVLGEDYKIVGKKFIINDINDYLSNTEFNTIEVTYTGGYSTLPKDIVFFHTVLVEGELAKEGGKEIKSEKLGPRTVTYADTFINESIVNAVRNKYINIIIC